MIRHKVIIVEDEEYIRESLRTVIDWPALGCRVSEVFASAEEALDYLQDEKIEIVISDIKMDGMSGLDMGRIINQKYPETRILFLTGYGDLEKARSAIRHNAWDFLLKPTRPDELMDSLGRLSRKISEEKKREASIAQLRSSAERAAPVIRQELLKQLYVDAPFHDKEILRLQKELSRTGYGFSSFHTALVQIIASPESEHSPHVKLVSSIISGKLGEKSKRALPVLFFQNAPLQLILLLTAAEYENLSNRLVNEIEKENGLTVQIGISSRHYSILRIRESLNEARQALNMSGISITPFVSYYRTSRPSCRAGTTFEINRIYQLKNYLLSRDEKQIDLLLRDFNDYITISEAGLPQAKDLIMRLMVQCEEALIKSGQQSYFNILSHELSASGTFDEMLAVLRHNIQLTSYSMRSAVKKRQHQLMDQIEQYLLNNYKRECTISDMARECNRNEKYLSRYIKKATGRTFSEYLCRMRIAKAEELLIQTGLPVTEVALSAGFNDPAYFSRVFVKIHGYSPRDFRKKIVTSL